MTSRTGPIGALDHVGLTVADLPAMTGWYAAALDMEVAYDTLLAAGASDRMSPRPSPEPGVRMAYVADPEGNLVELLDRTTSAAATR